MQKNFLIQLFILTLFLAVAAGSASTNTSSTTKSSSSYSYDHPNTLPEYKPIPLEKVDFPNPCETCKGKKGWYVFDTWVSCKRCGGTGVEPKH